MKTINNIIMAAVIGTASLVGMTACMATPTNESGGQYVDSAATTTKVKAALFNTAGLNSTQISVSTYKGTVQLSGFVDSAAQVALAGKTAASVSGVNQVENDLKVRTSIGNE